MSSYTSAHPSSANPSDKPGTRQSDTTGSVPLSLLSARSSTNDSAPKVPTREHTASIQSSVGVGLSVLVVDDDPFIRGLLQRLLVRLGCEVEGAENGQVALQKLGTVTEDTLPQPDSVPDGIGLEGPLASTSGGNFGADSKRTYDSSFLFSVSLTRLTVSPVIFLDNQMPKMTGPEVANTLRKHGRRDFLVGLSGDSNVLDQERFRQAGVDEYVLKIEPSPGCLLTEVPADFCPNRLSSLKSGKFCKRPARDGLSEILLATNPHERKLQLKNISQRRNFLFHHPLSCFGACLSDRVPQCHSVKCILMH
jgi:CheY-like chemotaxis protein